MGSSVIRSVDVMFADNGEQTHLDCQASKKVRVVAAGKYLLA